MWKFLGWKIFRWNFFSPNQNPDLSLFVVCPAMVTFSSPNIFLLFLLLKKKYLFFLEIFPFNILFLHQKNIILKYSIVRLSFVDLRWAQLYVSIVVMRIEFCLLYVDNKTWWEKNRKFLSKVSEFFTLRHQKCFHNKKSMRNHGTLRIPISNFLPSDRLWAKYQIHVSWY